MALHLDPVATATYTVTLAAPITSYVSIRLARARDHDRHRLIQAVILVVCWMSVLALELRIRLAGGSGVFVEQAPPGLIAWGRGLLAVHIVGAVATYALWTWLAVASWRRYPQRQPGVAPERFWHSHRRLGTLVFGGLCFTAATATGIFVVAFVL